MAQGTEFETKVQGLIEKHQDQLLEDIAEAADRLKIPSDEIEDVIRAFGGHELADVWRDYEDDNG